MTLRVREKRPEYLIIGGGPAGSAAAIELGRAGKSVLLIERSQYDGLRIGETLPPAANALLERLGLSPDSISGMSIRSPGTACCWGSGIPRLYDSLFDPEGDGLHLRRNLFDAALAALAEAAGAEVLRPAKVSNCRRRAEDWLVELADPQGPRLIRTTHLIDAAGRAAWRGRPSRRQAFDRQVACIGFFEREPDSPALDQRTWIEATECGWWYSSLLPEQRLVLAFFSDADLVSRSQRGAERLWHEQLSQTNWMSARLKSTRPIHEPRIVAASSTLAAPMILDRYTAIGDAASTIDPLSSQGIFYAMTTAIEAVEALLQPRQRDALHDYARGITRRFFDDLQTRRDYCRLEARWPDSPFWRRRHDDNPVSLADFP